MDATAEREAGEVDEAVKRLLAFVNTRPTGGGDVEKLETPANVERWLVEHGYDLDAGKPVTESDTALVQQIRHSLVTLLLSHTSADGSGDDAIAERLLSDAAVRYPINVVVGRTGVRLAPTGGSLAAAISDVLGSAAELALTGRWSRLKACRNHRCRIGFYDRSRNTSGAYCSHNCSSQDGMRAYRRRARAALSTREAE